MIEVVSFYQRDISILSKFEIEIGKFSVQLKFSSLEKDYKTIL